MWHGVFDGGAVMSELQPIATAPRDGTMILGYGSDFYFKFNGSSYDMKPSHWLPWPDGAIQP